MGSILFARNGDVWTWSDGSARMLFEGNGATDPRWSPDGSAVLYVTVQDAFSDLVLRSLADGRDTPLTKNEPPFEPGSREYVDNSVWVRDPAWSASGLIAFASEVDPTDKRMALWLLTESSSAPVLAPGALDAGSIEGISLSADGRLAVYTERPVQPGGGSTWVIGRNFDDGSVTLIAADEGGVFNPAISPDAASVVVSIRAANGVTDLWRINWRSGARQQLTREAQAIAATWSPDGKWLGYLTPEDDGFALWAMPMSGELSPVSPRKLDSFDGLDATGGLSWTLATIPDAS